MGQSAECEKIEKNLYLYEKQKTRLQLRRVHRRYTALQVYQLNRNLNLTWVSKLKIKKANPMFAVVAFRIPLLTVEF